MNRPIPKWPDEYTLVLYPLGVGGQWWAKADYVNAYGGGSGGNTLKARVFHSRGLVMRYLRKYAQHHKRKFARVVLATERQSDWRRLVSPLMESSL